jgi:hypothetical protein
LYYIEHNIFIFTRAKIGTKQRNFDLILAEQIYIFVADLRRFATESDFQGTE